jgi:ABC-type multidrug transport system fused ATPase/permease subunit
MRSRMKKTQEEKNMQVKKEKLYHRTIQNIGFDKTMFMMQFIKGSWLAYITGVLLISSYRFIENVVLGQLYAATAAISIEKGVTTLLITITKAFMGVTLLVLMSSLGAAINGRTAATIDLRFRKKLTEKISRIPLSQWHKRHSGDWMALMGRDADGATEAYKMPFIMIISMIFQFIGGLIIILPQFPEMAIYSATAGTLYLITALTIRKKSREYAAKLRQYGAEASSRFTDIINGLSVLRVFKMLALAKERHDEATEELYKFGMKATFIFIISSALDQLGYTISYMGALIFGLIMVSAGKISISAMLAYWPIAMGVSYSMMRIGLNIIAYQSTVAAVERVYKLFEIPEENGGERYDVPEYPIALELSKVTYSYEETKVLDNISFKVKKGETVALVGGSGGGKSTLVKLLMRFYNVDSGEIKVFGNPLEAYDLEALRGQFSYVPQICYLVGGSISENISIVKDKATFEEISRAAKQAYADDFIRQLPEGYDTKVGEQGTGLSGGQCQRIAIARAFIKDAPIFLFDEATASLDGESETNIDKSISDLSKEHTVIFVAHRLSTARKADRIIVIENGQVLEEGNHEYLLTLGGRYYTLWNEQQQGA